MWTGESRGRHNRSGLRYPSDLNDEEWRLIEPLLPPARHGGRHRSVDVRAVLNGVLYVLETGRQWRHPPKDLLPRGTVHGSLRLWVWEGRLERIHHDLCLRVREQEGREASPTAAMIDSQSVRAAEKGGLRRTRSATTRARRSEVSQIPRPRRQARTAPERHAFIAPTSRTVTAPPWSWTKPHASGSPSSR